MANIWGKINQRIKSIKSLRYKRIKRDIRVKGYKPIIR